MRLLPICLLLLVPFGARADALDELRARLATLPGNEPVAAHFELAIEHAAGDDDDEGEPKTDRATIAFDAEHGADGVDVHWPAAIVAALAREARERDPEAARPVGRAVAQASAQEISEYLQAAPKLAATLDHATLVADEGDTRNGVALRRLTLELDPPLSKSDRKYVKKLKATARVWLDDAGMPVAAEQSVEISARAMLVISFETSQRETYEFKRHGDRLVVTRHHSESSGSGAGESSRQRTDATVVLK
jgi:hypothetical protein